ncbi:MAG: glycosyltransferase family 39 protein [Anaerolineales bacterium]|nr:glycosyltransferase family 39 protein [Anaerolineales bacterium]
MTPSDQQPSFFPRRWAIPVVIGILFVLALGIRLFDLTDPPNDFYMVRQYRSALIARGMYYQTLTDVPDWKREMAVAQWKSEALIEPPLMESLVALTYRVTGERLWIARIYSSLFWLLGGVALFLLAGEMNLRAAGVVALAYYLFLPFGVIASRTFLPDPLMTALIVWALWALYRWEARRTGSAALLAGALTGLAILVKSVAVFPLLGAAAGLVLSRGALKRIILDKQVWAVAGLTALPNVLFYIYGLFILGTLGDQFAFRFFPDMLRDPGFYVSWVFTAGGLVGFEVLLIALVGVLVAQRSAQRGLLIGLWISYLIYGLAFPYHFITHNYYHLPLIPIVAIGLLPITGLVMGQLAAQKGPLPLGLRRAGFLGILFFGILINLWEVRVTLVREGYRHEIPFWQELGQIIGHDKSVIELSGDYGYRLAYWGWVNGAHWMTTADVNLRQLAGQQQPDFAAAFAEQTAGKDLFVITSPPEWQSQADLREYLTTHYQLIAMDEGDGYWIFDLHQRLH